jgi:hypothetical protein
MIAIVQPMTVQINDYKSDGYFSMNEIASAVQIMHKVCKVFLKIC